MERRTIRIKVRQGIMEAGVQDISEQVHVGSGLDAKNKENKMESKEERRGKEGTRKR